MNSSKAHSKQQRLTRVELLELLDHSKTLALTLILAPAGSGKSTLLQQWCQQNHDCMTAQLALSRRDQDPILFFRRLYQTLEPYLSLSPIMSGTAIEADENQLDLFLQYLLDALGQLTNDFFLVIDDFHYANTPLIQSFFADLLSDLPAHVHIIIASRNHPTFPLSRLKLDDKLLIIDHHDLRLELSQVNELCQLLLQPTLSQDELQELLRVTEGWIAGIKLALLARAKAGQLTMQNFTGTHPEIVNYFLDVVLSEIDQGLRQFLLVSSILDKVDTPIMDYLLPDLACKQLIHRIWQKNLFITILDDQTSSFRYHPLFQQSLQTRLNLENPHYVQQLHLKAAEYFLKHQDPESALHHACLLNNTESFHQILAQCCNQWLKEGKLTLMLSWLNKLDPSICLAQPELSLLQLSALIFSRQFNAAFYLLKILKKNNLGAETTTWSITLTFLENVLNLFHSDIYDPNIALNSIYTNIHYHDLRDSCHTFLARYFMLKGDCESAIRHAKYAKILLKKLGHDYLSSFNDVILILSERELGHVINARQMTYDFFQQYESQPQTPCWVNAATCMAVSLYEQNRHSEAKTICEQLMLCMDSACVTELMFHVYVTLARLQGTQSKIRANQLLAQLRRILRHGKHTRLLNQLLSEEVCHALRTHQPEQIHSIMTDYDFINEINLRFWEVIPEQYNESWLYQCLATALYLRTQKQYDMALMLLKTLESYLQKHRLYSRKIIIIANQIVIFHLQDKHSQAQELLSQLFQNVGLQCGIRTVFDEAPLFADIVGQAHQKGLISLPDVYLHQYHDLLFQTVSIPHVSPCHTDSLTTKEIEILNLIQRGLSNKEICSKLSISLSTTKWHIQNIFSKLQVNNRVSLLVQLKQQTP